ncbi:MAG: DUF4291 domain-containing protein [Anaeromyxobacter sp.]
MKLETAPYLVQRDEWPATGRHILAQHDAETVVVYQAYAPAIGRFAAKHGRFGGEFSYDRMSWVKPNFLWMMYRSDWGRSENQTVVLAVRLRRTFFDALLAAAVPSSFRGSGYADEKSWQAAVAASDVRLQWDPDHRPTGQPCERRALQLGLRRATLAAYGTKETLEILDISSFVAEQRDNVKDGASRLMLPRERVYLPADPVVAERLGLGS